jgi:hypothetical protein
MTPCPVTKEAAMQCKDDPNTISIPRQMALDINNLVSKKRKK